MIEFKKLAFGYTPHRALFADLSLSIPPGGVCGLLGGNGMGKSTLLKLAAGLLVPRGGKIEIAGQNPADKLPSLLSQMIFVPEEFDMPATTLARFAAVTAPFYPNFSHQRLDDYAAALRIDRDKHFRRMSMGEKKKAYIAFAMACDTPYLFMDEPTNGLDIPGKSALRSIIAETTVAERTMIIATHQTRDVENLLDRVVILDRGTVLVDRSVVEIEADGTGRLDLENFYLKSLAL